MRHESRIASARVALALCLCLFAACCTAGGQPAQNFSGEPVHGESGGGGGGGSM